MLRPPSWKARNPKDRPLVIALLLKARHLAFLATVILFGLLMMFGLEVSYDQSIQSFFAEDDPAVLSYQEASAQFGNDQFVFIAYDDPELLTGPGMDRVSELAEAIDPDDIDGVIGVQSLDAMPVFWQLDDALFALEQLPKLVRPRVLNLIQSGLREGGTGQWATPTIGRAVHAASSEDLPALRERIQSHPMLEGTLVSSDGTATALMVQLKSSGEHDAKATVSALRERADRFAERHGLNQPAVVGPPVLLADGFIAIERDGQRLALVGMLLIGVVTLTATQSFWWALMPILAGWTVWLTTQTILALLDWKLSLSSGPLVAQIIVLTMPAASHLALHYRDDRRQREQAQAAADETLRSVSVPIFWCAVTSMIGYGALVTSNVVPIRQFGAVLAISTAAATLLTLILSPTAMLPPFPMEIPVKVGSKSKTAFVMRWISTWVYRHPAPIVFGTLAITIPLALGIFQLKYESSYINAFKQETRVRQDYYFVESRLGGIGLVGLVVPVEETLDATTLDRFRNLDRQVLNLERPNGSAAVDHVFSLATVLDPDNRLEHLVDSRKAWLLGTKLDLIAASPQGRLLNSFWNRETNQARVMVRLLEQQPTPVKMATFDSALKLARGGFGDSAYLTGLSNLLTQTTRGVIDTQWTTFTLATLGIFSMLILAFRGLKLAALAILPTLLSVGMVLGLMGWLGIKLDIATALVASVALGLSVDDTFHCLLQFRRRRKTSSFEESLFASYAVTGPGVLLSSFAVAIGFTVLWFSEFVPFQTFGAMVAIATAGSSLGNIVLLPACLALAERWRTQTAAQPVGVAVESLTESSPNP